MRPASRFKRAGALILRLTVALLASALGLLAVSMFVTSLFPRSTPAQSQQAPPIRVRVNRVNVGVIVTDSRANFVEGLDRGDFHIFSDAVEQPVTDFAALDDPAQVVLLIESGPAVYLFAGGHLHAARQLLAGLSPGDRVAIIKYADRPAPVLGFTPDKQAATEALENLRFNLGFGQLNLSSSLSQVLDGLESLPRKKTIVLLSTGVDTSPEGDSAAILSRLKLGDVRVLAVSLSGELQSAPRNKKNRQTQQEPLTTTSEELAEASRRLQLLAEASGGRSYFPKTAKEFAAAYAEIAQLVRHEYSLAFAPPETDGHAHVIDVRLIDPRCGASPPSSTAASACRIDHRRAYLAPSP